MNYCLILDCIIMIKAVILIIEDEFIISNDLSSTLQESGYAVAGIAENVNEALVVLNNNSVDLILLDINLNEAVDGVDIAHIINTEYKLPFVFVTAFTDMVTIERVKHTKPYGYVTKPFSNIDLIITIDLALNRFRLDQKSKNAIIPSSEGIEIVFIKTREGLEKIKVSDIRWIEAYDYYSYIRLKSEKILATITLKDLEQKIEHTAFIKLHRKYTVNFNHIDKVIGNQVEIAGELIPISRSHKEGLLKKLNLI